MKQICGTHLKHIIKKFTKKEDELYYNERLEKEIEKRKNYSESRAKNRLGKTLKPKPVKPKAPKKTYVPHMENENEDVNRDEIKDENRGESANKIIYPFDTKDFKDNWDIWLKYKQQRKDKYTPIGEQGALKKLSVLANGKVNTAIAIIHQSIENGWAGLFELKSPQGTTTQKNNYSEAERIIYGK